jgi:hypothetical protein
VQPMTKQIPQFSPLWHSISYIVNVIHRMKERSQNAYDASYMMQNSINAGDRRQN